MKKQDAFLSTKGKLSLSKKTISNLSLHEMTGKAGGGRTQHGRKCQTVGCSLPPACNTLPDTNFC